MGNVSTWQETAVVSLAQLAIALQPHHHASLGNDECYALACILRQQLSNLPGMVVETAAMSDLIERMEQRLEVPVVPVAHRSFLAVVPA